MKKLLLLSLLVLSSPLLADTNATLMERIERLEERVKLLEQGSGDAAPPMPHETSEVGKAREVRQSRVSEEKSFGYAMVRYWLGKHSPFEAGSEPPMASGRMKLGEDILFQPKAYGASSDSDKLGFFSKLTDPSINPVASLQVDGVLNVPETGDYTLLLKPTPPREVGGAGNVELAVEIVIDRKRVVSHPFSSSLAPIEIPLVLAEGERLFAMQVVARSPGFGPSPTRARLFVGLKGGDAVAAEPINRFLSPPH